MARLAFSTPLLLALAMAPKWSDAGGWPRFRGVNGAGRAVGTQPLPDRIGPTENVIWKTKLPRGHSSPVLDERQIYVTADDDGKLSVIALDRETGKTNWRREVPVKKLEEVHNVGNRAQSTCAVDGQRVVSFFGSAGLFCHTAEGTLLWSVPMGPFKDNFGAASSPIIEGEQVILYQDHDTDSFLASYDAKTGEQQWRVDRSSFPRSFSTPVIWDNAGKRQIVIAATLEARGYDLATGKEAWRLRGISRLVNMTPTVDSRGILYIAAWAPGGDDGERLTAPAWPDVLAPHDKDKNGQLEAKEMPEGELSRRFDQIDRDKDGHISEVEFESMRQVFNTAKNVIVAVKPGGAGDITDSHVVWRHKRLLPYCPSPVLYDGVIFMVKNGGIVSSLDAKTGEPVKQGRVAAKSDYYSSPVAGDGKVYLLSQRGEATVLTANGAWREVSATKFDEDAYATPALVDGRVYLRTASALYCFGKDGLAARK